MGIRTTAPSGVKIADTDRVRPVTDSRDAKVICLESLRQLFSESALRTLRTLVGTLVLLAATLTTGTTIGSDSRSGRQRLTWLAFGRLSLIRSEQPVFQ